MSAKTPINAAVVSRVLGKREKRSQSHATRVRGYHDITAGFKVREPQGWSKYYGQQVWVEYRSASGNAGVRASMDESGEAKRARLERYAQVLRDAGYVALVRGTHVVVSKEES